MKNKILCKRCALLICTPFSKNRLQENNAERYNFLKNEESLLNESMSEIRMSGINDIEEVKEAYMGPNGRISIIGKSGKSNTAQNTKQVF